MFHLRAKIVGRSSGRSAAGASAYRTGGRNSAATMAYRSGEKLRDPTTGRTFDYSRKAMIDAEGFGILHTEIFLPLGAPEWMADRQALIDAVEAKETRTDAQLFREIEVSLPRELTFEQQRELIRDFVKANFVSRGMIADLAIHDEEASDGGRNPHAHVLLTMRTVSPDGFGKKERSWNAPELLRDWRQAWATLANERLAEFGHERRLDHRSHRARDIDLEPDTYVGPTKGRDFEGVLHAERQESRYAAKQKNIDLIAADPEKLIAMVSREKATFTAADLAYALRRATALEMDDPEFHAMLKSAIGSSELVAIASDKRGVQRYATREMIACEAEMAQAASTLARRETFDVGLGPSAGLSIEQKRAFLHATQGPDLVAISGVAGAGKTTTLADVARAFNAAGYRVRGAALAAVAAKNLSDEAGIASSTLASTFARWDHRDRAGRPDPIAKLQKGDVFILDEAGLVGSNDMRRLLVEAEKAEAKVILVGDAQQLQAIEAGAAFRAIAQTHGAAELRDVRRQRTDWQRNASTLLAQGRAAEAMSLYRDAGALRPSDTTEAAMDNLVAAWMAERDQGGSQLILSYYTADIKALNAKVRQTLRASGRLGPDIQIVVKEQKRDEFGEVSERAHRATFAQGDRLLFTRNDRTLDVQNGSTGEILDLDPSGQLKVRMSDGRDLAFAAQDYPHLALGYAMTVHKAQGGTYDRTYLLASNRLNAHIGYVALTRHREAATVFYGRDQFPEERGLDACFSRQQPKDTTLDYLNAYRGQQRDGSRSQGETALAPDQETGTGQAPLSAAERIRQNVAQRRRALSRAHTRDRSYGD